MIQIGGLELKIGADMSGVNAGLHRLEENVEDVKRDIDRLNKSIVGTTAAATGLATAAAGIGTAVAAGAAGAAGGFATIGVIASATKTDVQNTFKGLGQQISATFKSITGPIDQALTHVARVASGTLGALESSFAEAFETVGPYIETAADTLSRFAQTVMPAAVRITKAAAPVVSAVASGFDALSQGLAGFFDGLQQGMSGAATTIEALFGALGRLLPVLGDVMGSISQAAETLGPAFADAFTELTTVVLRFLEAAIVPLAPHIATVVEGFTSFMQAIRESVGPVAAFTSVALPLAGLFAGMTSAISPVKLAVTALAAAAVTLHNNWKTVTAFIQQHKQVFAGMAGLLASALVPALYSVGTAAASAIASAAATLGSFVAAAAPVIAVSGGIAAAAIGIIENWSKITPYFSKLWQGVKNIVWGAKEAIVGTFDKMWIKVQKRFVTAAKNLLDPLAGIANALGASGIAGSIEGVQDSLKNMVPAGAMSKAQSRVTKGVEAMRQEVIGGAEAMRAGLGSALDAGGDLLGKAKSLGSDLASTLKSGFDSAMGDGLMKGVLGGGSAAATAADVAASKVEQLRSSIQKTVSEADALAKRVPESLNAVKRSARSAEEAIQSMVGTIENIKIPDFAKALAKELGVAKEKVRGLSRETAVALNKLAGRSKDAARQVIDSFHKIRTTLQKLPAKLLSQTATGIGKALGGMMARAFGAMTKQQERLKRRIRSTQKELQAALSEGASEQVARLKDKLSQLRDAFEQSKFTLADVGKQLIKTLAGALQKIGSLLIGAGTAFAILGPQIGGIMGLIDAIIGNPFGSIAAGTLLTGLGTGLGMAASSAPAPVGSGSTPTGSGGGTPYRRAGGSRGRGGGGGTLTARVEGSDLLFALEEEKRRRER